MSKIQDFVDGYGTEIEKRINIQIDKQNLYKTTRIQAIAISELNTSGWPNSSTTTIGQLISCIFPEIDGGKKVLPPDYIGGGSAVNPDNLSVVSLLKGRDSSSTTKELYITLEKNNNTKSDINNLNRAKSFGGQKWFDNFMKSALGMMKKEEIKITEFNSLSTFEESYDDLVENFKSNFSSIAINYSPLQVLYDAFIEAGENYQSNTQAGATQSGGTQSGGTQSGGTQSNTQSTTKQGDYKITVKDAVSDISKKIEGTISFENQGPRIKAIAVLNNLPNPFTNSQTNLPVENNTGSLDYTSEWYGSDIPKNSLADGAISAFKDMIANKYGVNLTLQYEEAKSEPVDDNLSNTPEVSNPGLTSSNIGQTSSTFDSTGLKVTLSVKSGPGEIIGITERVIENGFIDFNEIQFDTEGEYVVSISTNSDLVEVKDVTIVVVSSDDIIPQEESRGGEPKNVEGTRPIIAQIDKPTVKLNPIEFQGNDDAHNKEVGVGLGFTPFFWYNGYQVNPRDIRSLKLYYDGLVPKAIINFGDSIGFMKREGMPLDDTKFEVFLNSGSKNLKSIHMKFKVIDFKNNKGSYTVTGSIDLNDFYKINFKSYKGTSFEVLRNVSSELQLGFNSNITNTVDNMSWVNHGVIFKDFISGIINHSYISETSYVLGYIDYYYCFNYVDIEKEWIRDISKDVGLASTGVNFLNGKDEKDRIQELSLTNDYGVKTSPFYFQNYNLNNNSTNISTTKGYYTVSKAYDSSTKQFLVFDVDSQSSDNTNNISLKGAPGDGKSMNENYRTKYSGKMDTENVHKNYYYSETQNKVNLDNMVRISVDLELPNANFNLYKFMKIKLNFINKRTNVSNKTVIDERLTGEWIIVDIGYTWVGGKLSQNVKCVRKELSKTKEEINDDASKPASKPEVNSENNENPIGSTQSITNMALPPNSIYKEGDVYIVESKDGKRFTLTVTKILENGKEVSAVLSE